MTIISEDRRPISSRQETLGQFTYTLGPNKERFGIEFEQAAIDKITLRPTAVPRSLAVINLAAEQGVEVLPEASSAIFEVLNHTPFSQKDGPETAANDILRQRKTLLWALKQQGQIPLPGGIIPFTNLEETCLHNLHNIPRALISIDGYFKPHRPDFGEYVTSCAGVQSSVTLSTPLKRLEYFSRAAHLAPLLSLLTASTPPFVTTETRPGEIIAARNNIGLERRLNILGDLNNQDNLQEAFPGLGAVEQLDGASALAFAQHWNESTWTNPFWCYYDPADNNPSTRLRLFGNGERKSLSDLPALYHTQENYTLLSKKFGLVTLSIVPPTPERDAIRRIELRFLDSGGPEQIKILAALTHALAFDPVFGNAVDTFLETCGLSPRAPKTQFGRLLESLRAAALTPYQTLNDIHFGTVPAGKAALAFANTVLKPSLNRYPGFEALIKTCESGITPALAFRKQYGADLGTFQQALTVLAEERHQQGSIPTPDL